MIIEYSDTLEAPATAVFALLSDLNARSSWITGILEMRVTPPGPARLGTTYFEAGKFSGFKSEKTLIVTEYEQDRLLSMVTEAGAKQPWRESYRIEPLSEGTCNVYLTIDAGEVPKVAEFFMRQAMKKEQPQQIARLRTLLADQSR
jgi:ribosome-associated toxin RatA of RatAB toxin-antitoxin module